MFFLKAKQSRRRTLNIIIPPFVTSNAAVFPFCSYCVLFLLCEAKQKIQGKLLGTSVKLIAEF